jgi:hypothetical protein
MRSGHPMSGHAVWHDNSTWPTSLGAVEADAVVARHVANRRLFELGGLPSVFTLRVVDATSTGTDDPCSKVGGSVVITPDGDHACLART